MCCICGEREERVGDKCFDRERDCELREFRVRESRKCKVRDRESRNCVTVNLVSAAFVIASAASLTFERMTLILNEIVNIPSSVFCQISHSASWRCFTIRERVRSTSRTQCFPSFLGDVSRIFSKKIVLVVTDSDQ